MSSAGAKAVALGPLGQAALLYAENDWCVFPCIGKKPETDHGFKDATTDPEQVRQRWTECPNANIGLALPIGIVVVDIDDPEAKLRLKAEGRDLPATLAVKTGRGEHYYYRTSKPLKQITVCKGVDLRVGGKGYVIAPGSIHANGQKYTVMAGRFNLDSIAEAPEWLEEFVGESQHQPLDTARILQGVDEEKRNDSLFKLSSKFRQADLPREHARKLILEAAGNCTPPLPEAEAIECLNSAYSRYEPGGDSRREIQTPDEVLTVLNGLDEGLDIGIVERLLRQAATKLKDADRLAQAAFREAAILVLKGKVGSPARLVDAAFYVEKQPESSPRGELIAFADVEPWEEPVDGALLLKNLCGEFARFLVLPSGAAAAISLWAIHTYAVEASRISPRLAITSPTKQCGKTTLLDCLEASVLKPIQAANLTPSVIFRTFEKYAPTGLIDEYDTFKNNDELRGVLNAGHRMGGKVIRNVPVGDDWEPRPFSVYGAVAIALIGKLQGTLADRSIEIKMRRRARGETIEAFRLDRPGEFSDLRRKAARWVGDHLGDLLDADPEIPDGLFNRSADNWRPLLAIADLAGGHWPERARKAARLLSGVTEDTSVSVQLLADIRSIFEERGAEWIGSQEIALELTQMEDRPWPEWGKTQKAITTAAIAKQLGKFEIKPKPNTQGSHRGYGLDAFEDAFRRYLPSKVSECQKLNEYKASPGISGRQTEDTSDTSELRESSIDSSVSDTLTPQHEGSGPESPEADPYQRV